MSHVTGTYYPGNEAPGAGVVQAKASVALDQSFLRRWSLIELEPSQIKPLSLLPYYCAPMACDSERDAMQPPLAVLTS